VFAFMYQIPATSYAKYIFKTWRGQQLAKMTLMMHDAQMTQLFRAINERATTDDHGDGDGSGKSGASKILGGG
jgi:hypothetical protein